MARPNGWDRLTQWIPGVRLFLDYDRRNLSADLLADLVVCLVLIPSAIAYADLAKCPPIAGIYAALGAMVAFALFTTSRHVIAGPDAAIALLVGSSIAAFSNGDPGLALALSTWLALLTGALLYAAAILRLGVAAEFLSAPVMLGFMNGAAVVIVVSQLGKLIGISLEEENTLLSLWEWLTRLSEMHLPTLATGLGCIAVLFALRLLTPRVPGTIVVFVLAIAAGQFVDFTIMEMNVIGVVDTRLPDPVPPPLSAKLMANLLIAAFGLSLIVFPEGVLLGRAVADRQNYQIKPDRELVALGAANLAAGFSQSFAVGASQTRTLLNAATGGRSQMVSLFAAALLIAFLLLLADLIAALPTVAIAAILIVTGITLLEFKEVARLLRIHPFSGWISISSTIGVIALGVLPGILLGVFLSLLRLLNQLARPQDALLGRVEGSRTLHDVGDDEAAKTIPGLIVYRFYGPLIFANVRYFIERLEHFIEQEETPVRAILVDARAIPEIDVTAAEQLKAYIEKLRERGIAFFVAKAHLPLRQAGVEMGLSGLMAEGRYATHIGDAVEAFERGELPAAQGSP